MPDDTYVRQESTLERYDDAKPILDSEYLVTRDPKIYRYDIELMPITKWLVTISIKCMIWPSPSPPPTPYWPCNMLLTEHRQTQCQKPHSPQDHSNGGEQRKPAAKRSQRRRHNVPGTHVESPEHLRTKNADSLPISDFPVRQTRSKTLSPSPSFFRTSTHQGTAARSIQYPDMSGRCDLRGRARSRH